MLRRHPSRRRVSTVVGLVLAAGVTAAVLAAPAGAAAPDGDYIVVLRDSVAHPSHVAAEHRRDHGAQVSFTYGSALKGYAARLSGRAYGEIMRDRRVAYVERDGVAQAWATQSDATWGLDRTDQRALPLSQTYGYDTNGAGVTAYVIDTGIRRSHSEFGDRVSAGGFTAFTDRHGTNDCNGHGTHVAGTIGGTIHGVAKQVALVPVRVLDCRGSGTWSGVIAGVDYVTSAAAGTRAVANMSLGGGRMQSVDDAVARSIAAGVTYAVAAGNSNADACKSSPAAVPAALTVAASDQSDVKASFSNHGTCVDLFAPGVAITSAWHSSDTAVNTISGTSMAAPHVAGAAARYLQTADAASSSPAAVASHLTTTASNNVITGVPAQTVTSLLFMAPPAGTGTDSGGDDTTSGGETTEPAPCTHPRGKCK